MWKKVSLKEVLNYEQPNEYIISRPLKDNESLTPVLTPNKSFIKGYTDEKNGIYNKIPAIIFDDFTTDNKFVNFPFKVKSSAMKILNLKRKDVLLKFVFYQMQIKKINKSTHKRYYISEYQNLDFIFPFNDNGFDLEQQQLIVDEIEKQLTRLDASVKMFKEVKKKLEVYRKSVLKASFEGKIEEISEWEDIALEDFGNIFTGTTPSTKNKEYYGNDFCFFRPKDLDKGFNIYESEIMLSDEGIKKARLLPEKSILVTCIGATIGKTGFSKVRSSTNQQINAIVPNQEKYLPELIYYLMISEKMQRLIKKKSSSTTMPILNKSKFMKLETKFPKNMNEQEHLFEKIESQFSVIDKVKESVDFALNKAKMLRKSILKSAFERKLVKQND